MVNTTIIFWLVGSWCASALNIGPDTQRSPRFQKNELGRREMLTSGFAALVCAPAQALAETSCIEDCLSNCNRLAPKSRDYCASR